MFEEYRELGQSLKQSLGQRTGIHILHLSDALNITKDNQQFLNKLIPLCINANLEIPLLIDDPDFNKKANALLIGMTG